MSHCVLCKSTLTGNEKPEHILLDALGGRATTKNAICSVCNGVMGSGPDKALAESVAPLRTFASLKSGSNERPPSLMVNPRSKDAYELTPDGIPKPKIKKAIRVSKDDEGNKILSITARDKAHLSELIPHAAKAADVPKEHWDKFADDVIRGSTIRGKPAEAAKGQLALGCDESQRAMAKACLVLWTELVGNNEVCSKKYDSIRGFILGHIARDDAPFQGQLDTRNPPGLPKRFGKGANIIWVGSDGVGTVRGYFRLFGAVAWSFILAEGSRRRNLSNILVSNPLSHAQWACGPQYAEIVRFDWVASHPTIQELTFDEPREAFTQIVRKGQEHNLEKAWQKAIADTFEEFGVPKGGTLSDHDREAFSERLSEKITRILFRLPYEDSLQTVKVKKRK